MSGPRVLLATCAEVPDGDDDERLGVQALRAAGVDVAFGVWDDPTVDWAAADLVVVRSAWDYARRHDDFLAWAGQVPRLANNADLLAWNVDKRYLAELAGSGVPIVPTTWYEPGDPPDPPGGPVVVKPSISAGSRDTRRHDDPAAALAHARALLDDGRTVMVQPYVAGVDSAGETGLVFVAGRFSHGFRKGPLLTPGEHATDRLFAEEEITPREPSAAERAVGEQVLDALESLGRVRRDDLLYARVDLVPGEGEPLLLELELAEPSLFFAAGAGAAQRWAAAVRTAADAAAARR